MWKKDVPSWLGLATYLPRDIRMKVYSMFSPLDKQLIEYSHGLGFPQPKVVCFDAASEGNLKILQWACSVGCEADEYTCGIAAMNGHLDILKWLHTEQNTLSDVSCKAASKGHLAILKWLDTVLPFPMNIQEVAKRAAAHGRTAVLNWVLGPKLSQFSHRQDGGDLCQLAATGGHLSTLVVLRSFHNCQWNALVTSEAAKGGHYDMLMWAVSKGCALNYSVSWLLAEQGNLDMLIWVREKNCSWDHHTTSTAARSGHLHVLKWAVENGCPVRLLDCLSEAKEKYDKFTREELHDKANDYYNIVQWIRLKQK